MVQEHPTTENTTETVEVIPIRGMTDVVKVRRRGLELAGGLGFELPDATRIAVVISELGRNIVLYTEGGTITLTTYDGTRKGVQIVAEDHGPGIADIEWALQQGHSTSKGLGLGLSASKRLMDEFEIISIVNQGTRITATKWLR